MKLGFIGCGNMGGALIGGILEHRICSTSEIMASTPDQACAAGVREKYGITVTPDNRQVAASSQILVLAVKPQYYEEVIEEIADAVRPETIVVAEICSLLSGCGKTEILPENLMDVVVSVSGSAPAYVFLFIEAMADAAVADGMPRAQAYKFASQAILGSAKMVLETGKHPGELKDMVCSPGGTTIEAVRVLEERGFRSAVIEAMKACTRKAKGM